MSASAYLARLDNQIGPLLMGNQIRFVLTAFLFHASVKIVPVVAELLHFTVNVSPFPSVRSEP